MSEKKMNYREAFSWLNQTGVKVSEEANHSITSEKSRNGKGTWCRGPCSFFLNPI